MTEQHAAISHTQKWLSSVVIAHNLCPFAKREFETGRIHYRVIETAETESQLEQLLRQCAVLDSNLEIETSLIIFPSALQDFEDYLDLLETATALLNDHGYEGIYQLASFHPDYRFDGAAPNAPSNYTNRSPYPMLHILREASLEAALKTYAHPENIPKRNIEHADKLGLTAMQALHAACYK